MKKEYQVYNERTAPKKSQSVLTQTEGIYGFIPNVIGQIAEAPTALRGLINHLGLLSDSSLTIPEQQIVLLEVASQCNADYCLAANATVAMMQGVSPTIIEDFRKGNILMDSKLEALRIFTKEMVQNRGLVSESIKEHFFKAGFTKENMFDVILGISLETLASYSAINANTPVDSQFQENAITV